MIAVGDTVSVLVRRRFAPGLELIVCMIADDVRPGYYAVAHAEPVDLRQWVEDGPHAHVADAVAALDRFTAWLYTGIGAPGGTWQSPHV